MVEITGIIEVPSFNAITTAFGALGTLLLAWVTSRTVKQNEEIITQREAKFRPKVRHVGGYSVDEGLNDSLVLELENVGNGKAFNLQITPELYILDDFPYQSLFEYTQKSNSLPTAQSHHQPLVTSDKNPLDYSHEGAVLETDETESFALRPDWKNLDVDHRNFDPDSVENPPLLVFHRVLELLSKTDVREMGFRFQLTYEDIFENSYEEEFRGPLFRVEEAESLSDAMGRQLWTMDDRDFVIVHSKNRSG